MQFPKTCPALHALLEDAARCFRHGLLLCPALVMVGVAYEFAVTHVAEQKLNIDEKRYAARLSKVRDFYAAMLAGNQHEWKKGEKNRWSTRW